MNVQFLTLSVSRNAGGLFFSVRSLAKHLQMSGADCRVLGPRDEFTDQDLRQWDPIKVDTPMGAELRIFSGNDRANEVRRNPIN